MNEYLAPNLVKIHQQLLQCATHHHGAGIKKDEAEAKIEFVYQQAKILGLRSTSQGAWRLHDALSSGNANQFDHAVTSVLERFWDDIDDLVFLYLPVEKRSYHQQTALFGETFKLNFPFANTEVIEAGNCFALGRHTACVFHLMRALEVVLKALFDALSLPPLTKTGDRNWNGILRPIKDKLEADKGLPDHDFYDTAYAFLAAAKNPLRNATMHVDASYDDESAKMVLDAVGSFMRHIATKLKE